ncbi:MAG: hypothetical protein ACFBSG_13550 [Leptolyngbyaceae cyanobacterium]
MSTKDLIQAELDRLDEALLNEVYLFITTYIQAKQNTTVQAEAVTSSPEATTVLSLPIRDHSAFLNSYSAADEGLYDDIAG